MSHSHAIVWMDSREAHVFRFSADDVERQRIRSRNPFRKIHHKAGVIGAGHVHLDHKYFEEIAEALSGVQEWLLTGPGAAKDELARHIEQHLPHLEHTLCGLQTCDHPTDGQLVDQARWAFKSIDRMRSNSVTTGQA
ncbi:MAG: translational machinery protein [Proteobacteria bacterium]|nr:translational machinery protein [Pseudomonadota bacterium]